MTSPPSSARISDSESLREMNERLMSSSSFRDFAPDAETTKEEKAQPATSSSVVETVQQKKIRLAISSLFPPDMSGDRASEYLKFLHSIHRASSTLTKLRWKGGGPPFRKVGKAQVLYSQDDLDEWAAKMLSKPLARTADFKSQTANS